MYLQETDEHQNAAILFQKILARMIFVILLFVSSGQQKLQKGIDWYFRGFWIVQL